MSVEINNNTCETSINGMELTGELSFSCASNERSERTNNKSSADNFKCYSMHSTTNNHSSKFRFIDKCLLTTIMYLSSISLLPMPWHCVCVCVFCVCCGRTFREMDIPSSEEKNHYTSFPVQLQCLTNRVKSDEQRGKGSDYCKAELFRIQVLDGWAKGNLLL